MTVGEMSPGKPAFRVHLDVDQGCLYARVDGADMVEGASLAYYLLHNGRRIEATPYGVERAVRFRTQPGEGRYRARAFLRSPVLPQTISVLSEPISREGASAEQRRIAALPVHEVDVGEVAALVQQGGHLRLDVRSGGLVYECLLGPRRGGSLFVVLAGAVPPRDTISLPRFSRFSWADDFPGTLLCVSDPTLHLSPTLRLGWYFGTRERDGIDGLVPVVNAIASSLAVPSSRVVAYGSSGGGFAALRLAARMGGGAVAVAVNAQTSIPAYAQRDFVEDFFATCLPGEVPESPDAALADRLAVSRTWSAAIDARALLLQNRDDPHHRDMHFRPFLRAVGAGSEGCTADGRVSSLVYRFPNGHGAEPRSMVPEIVERLAAMQPPAVVA